GQDVVPLDVVARRMPEDLRQGIAVMAVQPRSHPTPLSLGAAFGPSSHVEPGTRSGESFAGALIPGLLIVCLIARTAGKSEGAGVAEEVAMRFRDRPDAGRHLAEVLCRADFKDLPVVVVALPRGGAPVASEVAERLGVPLDVLVVRKLGVPFQPELAMGAIGEGGVRVENPDVLRSAGLGSKDLDDAERRERPELERRA